MRNFIFVDTNVLIYAHGVDEEDPRADQARELVAELWKSDAGVLSTQVLQEFYSVAVRKLKLTREYARGIVASYHAWCSVNTDIGLIVSASKLEEDHKIAFWDALVVESALRANATKLLSEDLQNGRKFGNLVIENPFA